MTCYTILTVTETNVLGCDTRHWSVTQVILQIFYSLSQVGVQRRYTRLCHRNFVRHLVNRCVRFDSTRSVHVASKSVSGLAATFVKDTWNIKKDVLLSIEDREINIVKWTNTYTIMRKFLNNFVKIFSPQFHLNKVNISTR